MSDDRFLFGDEDAWDPVMVLVFNCQIANSRAVTLEERAEKCEAADDTQLAARVLRRHANEHRERAAWLRAEAERLAKESLRVVP